MAQAQSSSRSGLNTTDVDVPPILVYLAVYAFTILSGVIALLVAGGDRRLKFHGLQALLLGVVLIVVYYGVSLVGRATGLFFMTSIAWLLTLLLWLYGLFVGYKASKGANISMPVIGKAAKDYART